MYDRFGNRVDVVRHPKCKQPGCTNDAFLDGKADRMCNPCWFAKPENQAIVRPFIEWCEGLLNGTVLYTGRDATQSKVA